MFHMELRRGTTKSQDQQNKGYLEAQNCTGAAQCFLETCPLLAECLAAQKKGRRIVSRVNGLNLTEIIDDYCDSHYLIAEDKQNNPNNYKDSKDSLKLSPHIKSLLEVQSSSESAPKSIQNYINTVTQTEESYSFKSKVPVSSLSITNTSHATSDGTESSSKEYADVRSGDLVTVDTSRVQREKTDISEVETVPHGLTAELVASTPNKRKTPRKCHSSLNLGDADSASSVKDIFNPAVMMKPLLDNIQLHEKLAEKINQVLNASNNSEGNVTEDQRIDNLESSSNEAVIHTVVEQTQADPIFDQLMNEIFYTAFDSKNGSESDECAGSRPASSMGDELESQETMLSKQNESITQESNTLGRMPLLVPATPLQVPCLLSITETPRSPGPVQTIGMDKELNTPNHQDTRTIHPKKSVNTTVQPEAAGTSPPAGKVTEYSPLKARLRSAQKRLSVAPTEISSIVDSSKCSETVQQVPDVIEDHNDATDHCIVDSAQEVEQEAHCVLVSTDVCVEMPTEMQEALTNNTMVLKPSSSGKNIIELAMANSSVLVPPVPEPITTFANAIITAAPSLLTQPSISSVETSMAPFIPQTNIYLPEYGRFLAIPVPVKATEKRMGPIVIAPKGPVEVEPTECRYLKGKQSKKLRAKVAMKKGVKLVPDRRIENTTVESSLMPESGKLVNILGSTSPAVTNPSIVVATVGLTSSELPPSGIISMPSISPIRPLSDMQQANITSTESTSVSEPQNVVSSNLSSAAPTISESILPVSDAPQPPIVSSSPEQRTTARQCPARKSMSTPRRDRSHIRTLDFSTPPQGKSISRKAYTSPKGKPPQISPTTANKLSRAKRIVRAELFQATEEILHEEEGNANVTIQEQDSITLSDVNETTTSTTNVENVAESNTRILDILPNLDSSGSQMEISISPQDKNASLVETNIESNSSMSVIATRVPGGPQVTRSCWDKVNGVDLILGSSPLKSAHFPRRVSARKAFGKDWDSDLRSLITPIEYSVKNKRSRDLSTSSERGGKRMKKVVSKEIVTLEDELSTDDDFESSKSKISCSNEDLSKSQSKVTNKKLSKITQKSQSTEVDGTQDAQLLSSVDESLKSKSKFDLCKNKNGDLQVTVSKKTCAPIGSDEDEISNSISKNIVSKNLDNRSLLQSGVESTKNSISEQVNGLLNDDHFIPPVSKSKRANKTRKSYRKRNSRADNAAVCKIPSSEKGGTNKDAKAIEIIPSEVPKAVENAISIQESSILLDSIEKSPEKIPASREPLKRVIIQSPRSVSKHIVLRNEIHGDNTKSPRRVLELASAPTSSLSYITPQKMDEPSTIQEETPLTKLLRGQPDAFELTLVETPLFPITPNCMIPTLSECASPPSPPNPNYFPTRDSELSKKLNRPQELNIINASKQTEISVTLHVVEDSGDEMETSVIETINSIETTVIESITAMETAADAAAEAASKSHVSHDVLAARRESVQESTINKTHDIVSPRTKSVQKLLGEEQSRIGLRKSTRNKSNQKSSDKKCGELLHEDKSSSINNMEMFKSNDHKSKQYETRPASKRKSETQNGSLFNTTEVQKSTENFNEDEMSFSSASRLLENAVFEQEEEISLRNKLEETKRRMVGKLKRDFSKNELPVVHLRTGASSSTSIFGKNTRSLLTHRFGKKDKMTTSNKSSTTTGASNKSMSRKKSTGKLVDTLKGNEENVKNIELQINSKEKSRKNMKVTDNFTVKQTNEISRESSMSCKKQKKSKSKVSYVTSIADPLECTQNTDKSKENIFESNSTFKDKCQEQNISDPLNRENATNSVKQCKSKDMSSDIFLQNDSTSGTQGFQCASGKQGKLGKKTSKKSSADGNKEVPEIINTLESEKDIVTDTSILSSSATSSQSRDTSLEQLCKYSAVPLITPLKITPRRTNSPLKSSSPLKVITPRKNISVDEIAKKLRGVIGGSDEEESMPPLVYTDSPEKTSGSECTILQQLGLHSCNTTPVKLPSNDLLPTTPRVLVTNQISSSSSPRHLTVDKSHDKKSNEPAVIDNHDKQTKRSEHIPTVKVRTECNSILDTDHQPAEEESIAVAVSDTATANENIDNVQYCYDNAPQEVTYTELGQEEQTVEQTNRSENTNQHGEQRQDSRISQRVSQDAVERMQNTNKATYVECSSTQQNSKVYRIQHEKLHHFKHLASKRTLKRLKLNIEKETDDGKIIQKNICLSFSTPVTLFSINSCDTDSHRSSRYERDAHNSSRHRHYSHDSRSDERDGHHRHRKVMSPNERDFRQRSHAYSSSEMMDDRRRPYSHDAEPRDRYKSYSHAVRAESNQKTHEAHLGMTRQEMDTRRRRLNSRDENEARNRSGSADYHLSTREVHDHKKEKRRYETEKNEPRSSSRSSDHHRSIQEVTEHRKEKEKLETNRQRYGDVEVNAEDDLMTYALVGSVREVSPDRCSPLELPTPVEGHLLPLKKRRGPTDCNSVSTTKLSSKQQRKADNPQDMLRKVGMDNLLSVLHGNADL